MEIINLDNINIDNLNFDLNLNFAFEENILKIDSFHDNQNKNLYNKSFNLHPEIKKTNQKDKKEIESTNNNLNLNNSETIETVQAIDNLNELLDLDNQLNIDYNDEIHTEKLINLTNQKNTNIDIDIIDSNVSVNNIKNDLILNNLLNKRRKVLNFNNNFNNRTRLKTYKKKNNIYCCNCGNIGHSYNNCLEPLTSYGLICFKKNKKLRNDKFDLYNYKVLLVRRKHTIGYVEFLRGKYFENDDIYITKLINLMTYDEKNKLLIINDFDLLRDDLGMSRNFKNNFKEYDYAKLKFNKIKDKLEYLIENSNKVWDEPEWGLPKGRRNNKETDIECAIREFIEETGIKKKNIIIFKNVKPLEEVYVGINNIKYKHVYFFSILNDTDDNQNDIDDNQNDIDDEQNDIDDDQNDIDNDEKNNDEYDNIPLDESNLQQLLEISKVHWYKFNDIKNLIRYYYASKMNVIQKGFQLINNINQYFEF